VEDKKIFDWENDTVCISQPSRCFLTIEAMREGIRRGWSPLSITVCRAEYGVLIPLDGNHRVSACYFERSYLEYQVAIENVDLHRSCSVSERSSSNYTDYSRLTASLIYLPMEVAREFCYKNATLENDLSRFFDALVEHKAAHLSKVGCVW
jgi:hypothetical protein